MQFWLVSLNLVCLWDAEDYALRDMGGFEGLLGGYVKSQGESAQILKELGALSDTPIQL